jgi:TATA-box binding protein (TBP) (component of TFIID and TFIIIB)
MDLEIYENNIEVQNIVGMININRELDLDRINEDITGGVAEYKPAKFPAVIFRPRIEGTVMIYRTGKIVYNGVSTYDQMLTLHTSIKQKLHQ